MHSCRLDSDRTAEKRIDLAVLGSQHRVPVSIEPRARREVGRQLARQTEAGIRDRHDLHAGQRPEVRRVGAPRVAASPEDGHPDHDERRGSGARGGAAGGAALGHVAANAGKAVE